MYEKLDRNSKVTIDAVASKTEKIREIEKRSLEDSIDAGKSWQIQLMLEE